MKDSKLIVMGRCCTLMKEAVLKLKESKMKNKL